MNLSPIGAAQCRRPAIARRPVARALAPLLLAASLTLAAGASPAASSELPDIGSPADALLPQTEEARIGRAIMRALRESGRLVEDPLVNEYIQSVGHRLVSHANDGGHRFEFFVVDDPSINAFALPGGFIGVHTGLIEATENESELAGVLSHEIAHVTQRHIARALHQNQRASLVTLAAMLGAVLVGAATGSGDLIQGAVMSAQAAQIQNQISFTRSNEYEADRVAVGTLAAAGFDPRGMPEFFATLGRRSGLAGTRVPEFLRTHPVTSARIAESRSRAERYGEVEARDSVGYGLARARLIATSRSTPEEAIEHFDNVGEESDAVLYGRAIALTRASRHREARRLYEDLIDRNEEVIAYHIGLAQALMATDDRQGAIRAFENARELFPRNVPLIIHYAETLLAAGRPERAHELLLDLLNNVPPTPQQVRLIARAAIEAGETAEAHYYMSEYNIMIGDLVRAIRLLNRALTLPDLGEIQRARFRARAEFLAEHLSDEQRKALERGPRTARSG